MRRKWFNSRKTKVEIMIEDNGAKLHVKDANFWHAVQLLKKYVHDPVDFKEAVRRLYKPGYLFIELPNGGSIEIMRTSQLVWE